MQGLSAAKLLGAWEAGMDQSPAQRALTLLGIACRDIPPDVLGQLSIGERDARLLALRQQTFGSTLHSLVSCPRCNEPLEFSLDVSDIRAQAASPPGQEGSAMALSDGEYDVSFRLPNGLDVAAIDDVKHLAAARQLLFQRCVVTASRKGEECPKDLLPSLVLDRAAVLMAQTDPQADVQLALSCPQCGHEWQAVFDIVAFFWAEISAWASRILHEVHTLASAYGWREADILTMSLRRRQCYLDMVGT